MSIPAPLLQSLVHDACTAPSSHNTQPWHFLAGGDRIALLADRTRALPVNDPHDRELTISCGAALMALRVAAAGAGLGARPVLLPEGDDADTLAAVALVAGDADAALAGLAPFLARRRTWRKPFEDRPVEPGVLDALAAAARTEGAGLHRLEGESKQQAADLVAEGDRRQWDDPRWRRELAMWMHPRRSGDGLAMPGPVVPVARAVVRHFDMGRGVAAHDAGLATDSPLLVVLSTAADQPVDWLRAGQALQRTLLLACRHGLQASYLNQPVQDAALRERLRAITGGGAHPQLLLRFGHAGASLPPTPRRPLAEVLDIVADDGAAA